MFHPVRSNFLFRTEHPLPMRRSIHGQDEPCESWGDRFGGEASPAFFLQQAPARSRRRFWLLEKATLAVRSMGT